MTPLTLEEPGPVERVRWAVADAVTVAGRDVAHWRRRPGAVLVGALFPVLLLLMFTYLLGGGMVVPGGGSYRDFLVPGMFVLAMVFGVEATMTAVVTDTARGITDRFRSLPMAPSAVVAGRCLADLASSVLGLAVLLAAALAVGWRPAGIGSALAAVALLLLLRLAFLWIGIYLGLLVRDPSGVVAVQILVWPFAFVSNTFAAPDTMPGWLGAVADWNPMSATAAACRELFGNPAWGGDSWASQHAVTLAVVWPVLLIVIFFPLSVRRYQRLSR
jgi:ABC-type multidrug transport system permease subunit